MPIRATNCQMCGEVTPAVCERGVCESCHHRDPRRICGPRCTSCHMAHRPMTRLNHQDICDACLATFRPGWVDQWAADETTQRRSATREAVSITSVHDGHFWYADRLADRQHWSSQRLAALEVEVCGARPARQSAINAVVARWGAGLGTDGSLPESGFELRTAPAAGDFLVAQLEQLDAAFTYQMAYVTNRAGLHCHVDCRDFTWLDAVSYIRLYAAVERALYLLVGPGRAFNRFSFPCGYQFSHRLLNVGNTARVGAKDALYQELYRRGTNHTNQQQIRQARANHDHPERYRGLNVHSWMYRGTMEVRIHPAETRNWAMLGWAQLMVTLADLAKADHSVYKLFPTPAPHKNVPLFSDASLYESVAVMQALCAMLPRSLVSYINARWEEMWKSPAQPARERAFYPRNLSEAGHHLHTNDIHDARTGLANEALGHLSPEQIAFLASAHFVSHTTTVRDRLEARRAA